MTTVTFRCFEWPSGKEVGLIHCENEAEVIGFALFEAGKVPLDFEFEDEDTVVPKDGGWFVYDTHGDLILSLDEDESADKSSVLED